MHTLFHLNPPDFLASSVAGSESLFITWIIIMTATVLTCFIVSELTENYSQVDKLWSLLPVVYGWVSAFSSPSPRIILMASLVTIWGLRLTYNFGRKGGYSLIPWKGEEDYRWKYLRESKALKGRFRFGIFNLLFISLFQNIVILLFASPMLLAAAYPEKSLTITDLAAALLMLTFIITETIADNQQYLFHQEKKKSPVSNGKYAESLKQGFLSEGLWKYVRHPNFTSEQAIWISFWLFGVAATDQWLNFTVSGPLLLILVFAGSSRMTESISSSKYPEYKTYQQQVPRFLPLKLKL
jgi:steroid 5-alpha reductase family enzyme